ncbi:MAG: thermonuclease family protein [Verrucomicrobiales bacterium]
MARRKSKQADRGQFLERLVLAVLLLAMALAFYFNYLAERLQAKTGKLGEFDVLEGAVLVDHGANDGDSFHVRHGGDEFVFRLYYVDCPEKDGRRFSERLAEQGAYFGGLAVDEVVELGLEAEAFVEGLLRARKFTVATRWEKVYDSGRYYAFVRVDGKPLSELLVERGFARIHTRGVDLPEGKKFESYREDLGKLESRAKAEGLGGWRAEGG